MPEQCRRIGTVTRAVPCQSCADARIKTVAMALPCRNGSYGCAAPELCRHIGNDSYGCAAPKLSTVERTGQEAAAKIGVILALRRL